MSTDWSFSNARITLEDGTVLRHWKEYTIDSDFLTPTDGWSFTFGTEVEWQKVSKLVRPDRKCEITIDGQLQCTGWIDRVTADCTDGDGVSVTVEGRDFLRMLVKANIHPATAVKEMTLIDMVESTFRQIYQGIPVAYVYDNAANRALMTGSKTKSSSKRKGKKDSLIDYCQAHANESAFEFCARNLRRFGLWMWATADGQVCVGAPNYDQPASYQIIRKRGNTIVDVERASYTHDRTNVPSHVFVRGRSNSKDWQVQKCKSTVIDPAFDYDDDRPKVFCPMMLSHDEATTDDQCLSFAWQELSRLKQDEKVYTCTLKGHRNPRTGNVYAIDTVAHVEDEPLGINDDFYVVRRTFKKSVTGGTTTELKLIPKGTIIFMDADAPEGA